MTPAHLSARRWPFGFEWPVSGADGAKPTPSIDARKLA